MANTSCQIECEDWIRLEWLPKQFGQSFYRERLRLDAGGVFDFDAVSADRSIAVSISTSGAKTASGKHAVGKLMKLRSDMLFLVMATVARRIVLLTERDMYDLCVRETAAGRVPRGIEFLHVTLPQDLCRRLADARRASSAEVTPGGVIAPDHDDGLRASLRERTPGNQTLLKIAQTHAPPDSWWDEDVDPFKPEEGA
jgi:hypothetical protein